MKLFVIWNSDGDTYVEETTEQEVLEELKEIKENPYLESLPENTETNYWPEGSRLIIKGEIIFPKPKKIVKSWELGE